MADENLLDKVHELSDLELAALICLVAQEHCIIDTEPDAIDELVQELEQVRIYPNMCRSMLIVPGCCEGLRPLPRLSRLLRADIPR
jgi:hypothetical protein